MITTSTTDNVVIWVPVTNDMISPPLSLTQPPMRLTLGDVDLGEWAIDGYWGRNDHPDIAGELRLRRVRTA